MSESDDDHSSDGEYVGYQHPPKRNQFKKGKSGNPAGRKKGSTNLATDLNKELARDTTFVENGRKRRLSAQRLLVRRLINMGLSGDRAAIQHAFALQQQLNGSGSEQEHKVPSNAASIAMRYVERMRREQLNEAESPAESDDRDPAAPETMS